MKIKQFFKYKEFDLLSVYLITHANNPNHFVTFQF